VNSNWCRAVLFTPAAAALWTGRLVGGGWAANWPGQRRLDLGGMAAAGRLDGGVAWVAHWPGWHGSSVRSMVPTREE
jgi:hypothetical protein